MAGWSNLIVAFIGCVVAAGPSYGYPGVSFPAAPPAGYPAYPSYPAQRPQAPTPDVLDVSKLTQRERQCYNLLTALQTGNITAVDVVNSTRFIQHNLAMADNKQGLLAAVTQGQGKTKIKILRVYQDGDFVFAHSVYTTIAPGAADALQAGFDVWRYGEDNLIAEHWDNLQGLSNVTNPSNRTMVDGPVQAVDLDQTDANKGLVVAYAFSQVNGRLRTELMQPNFKQHNPNFGDGVQAMVKGLADLAAQGNGMQNKGEFKVLGKGNFVLVMGPGAIGPISFGCYDMYRVENGKIAEQWNTVQFAPSSAQGAANTNGKFNG